MFSSFFQSVTPTQEYDHNLPEHIRKRATQTQYHHPDTERMMSALHFNENNTEIKVNELNPTTLGEIAEATNCSTVHFSGNCALLARCLLYNLKSGRNVLAVSNTYPFHESISGVVANNILFEKELRTYKYASSVDQLEAELLNAFQETGERCFLINVDRKQVLFSLIDVIIPGHAMNAVVAGSGDNAKVLFADAWKTWGSIHTTESLERRAFTVDYYKIQYHEGPTLYKELVTQDKIVPVDSNQTPRTGRGYF